jgi:hypothetical protein
MAQWNPMIRNLTNLFQNTNLKIAFCTNNAIYNILYTWPHSTNTHLCSGIYELKCHTWDLSYTGQTRRWLEWRFKEHIFYITSSNPQSAYVLYILHNTHKYGPMKITLTPLCSINKSKQMNNLENYYIQFFHQHNMIIEERTQKQKRPLFELTYDIQLLHACTWFPSNLFQLLHFSSRWFTVYLVYLWIDSYTL